MGQKVNPVGLRLNLTKRWESRWFANKKQFPIQLFQDAQIRRFLRKKYPDGGIREIVIFRNAKMIEVTIYTAKPGIIIGRSGAGMTEIRNLIEKILLTNLPKSDQPKIRIHVEELKNQDVYARVIAESVAHQIEKRIIPRRAVRQALEKLKEKGIKGAKIRVSGRLGGVEIARTESLTIGSIPLHTFRNQIDYAYVSALTTYGTIGVKVWINLGEYDFDKIDENEVREMEKRKER